MSDIIKKLKSCPAQKVQKEFCALVKEYLTPSFGSMSKTDFNVLLFNSLQKLGAIEKEPNLYDLTYELHLTKSRAQSLLYNANLRKGYTSEDLEKQLRKAISDAILLKEKDRVSVEIENPVLRDYLKKRLKELNHISDGSFSVDIIKMTHQAFADLYEELLPEKSEKEIRKALINMGVNESVLSSTANVVKKVLDTKLGDGTSDAIVDTCKNAFDYLKRCINDFAHTKIALPNFDDRFLELINK
ncbi:MAG: hypothetical protein IKN98_06030 [Bacteroidales bacterium]|jgi:hypothetical protein|nr:hypothetical protein [Bacteroidales bacterium]